MSKLILSICMCFCALSVVGSQPTNFTGQPTKKSGQTYLTTLWPGKTIRYTIDDRVPDEWMPHIENALAQFANNTCLKWEHVPAVERAIYLKYFRKIEAVMQSKTFSRSQKRTKINAINEEAKRKLGPSAEAGCVVIMPDFSSNSRCGFCNKGKHYEQFGQRLLIGTHNKQCFKYSIAHEMMHCIGFSHELDRIDRDSYITVINDRINERQATRFYSLDRETILPYGQANLTTFDYKSILLSSPYNLYYPNPAMPDSEHAGMNSRTNTLSSQDIQKVNRLYGCVQEASWFGA